MALTATQHSSNNAVNKSLNVFINMFSVDIIKFTFHASLQITDLHKLSYLNVKR